MAFNFFAVLAFFKIAFWFYYYGYVPNIIPCAPPALVTVDYPTSKVSANLGNELTPTIMNLETPLVSWPIEPNTYYTFIMIDVTSDVLDWLYVNIPGNDLSKGEAKATYIGGAPPRDSGFHLYTWFAYKQQAYQEFAPEYDCITNFTNAFQTFFCRFPFNLTKLTSEYGLELAAGNFVRSQFDSSVNETVFG